MIDSDDINALLGIKQGPAAADDDATSDCQQFKKELDTVNESIRHVYTTFNNSVTILIDYIKELHTKYILSNLATSTNTVITTTLKEYKQKDRFSNRTVKLLTDYQKYVAGYYERVIQLIIAIDNQNSIKSDRLKEFAELVASSGANKEQKLSDAILLSRVANQTIVENNKIRKNVSKLNQQINQWSTFNDNIRNNIFSFPGNVKEAPEIIIVEKIINSIQSMYADSEDNSAKIKLLDSLIENQNKIYQTRLRELKVMSLKRVRETPQPQPDDGDDDENRSSGHTNNMDVDDKSLASGASAKSSVSRKLTGLKGEIKKLSDNNRKLSENDNKTLALARFAEMSEANLNYLLNVHDSLSDLDATFNKSHGSTKDVNFSEPATGVGFSGPATGAGFSGPATGASFRGPTTDAGFNGPATSASFRGPATDVGFSGPARDASFSSPAKATSFSGPARDASFSGPARVASFSGPAATASPAKSDTASPAKSLAADAVHQSMDTTNASFARKTRSPAKRNAPSVGVDEVKPPKLTATAVLDLINSHNSRIKLNREDVRVLMSDNSWYTDNIMNRVLLMCNAAVDGALDYVDTLLTSNPSRIKRSLDKSAILFVFNDTLSHWICAYYDLPTGIVYLYDTLAKSVQLSKNNLEFFSKITRKKEPTIELKRVDQQKNTYDCGPMAVAIATMILIAKNPTECSFKPNLRQLIYNMLLNNAIEELMVPKAPVVDGSFAKLPYFAAKAPRVLGVATKAPQVVKTTHVGGVDAKLAAVDSVLPHADSVGATLPRADGVLPRTNSDLPPANGVLPRTNGDLPPVNGVLPRANGVLPPANGVLPRANGVLPPANGVLPRASDLPPANGVVPQADSVPLHGGSVMPLVDRFAATNITVRPRSSSISSVSTFNTLFYGDIQHYLFTLETFLKQIFDTNLMPVYTNTFAVYVSEINDKSLDMTKLERKHYFFYYLLPVYTYDGLPIFASINNIARRGGILEMLAQPQLGVMNIDNISRVKNVKPLNAHVLAHYRTLGSTYEIQATIDPAEDADIACKNQVLLVILDFVINKLRLPFEYNTNLTVADNFVLFLTKHAGYSE